MKFKVFMLLFCFSTAAHAYDSQKATVNLAADLSMCASFYLFMSKGLEKMNKDTTHITASAMKAFDKAAEISNIETTTSSMKLFSTQMSQQMGGDWSNAPLLIDQYASLCKATVQNPQIRLQFWLNKK